MSQHFKPIHYYGYDGEWQRTSRQSVSVNVGTESNPKYVWRKVLYRWVGHNNRWYLTDNYVNESADFQLHNARYFEGSLYRGDIAIFGEGLEEPLDPLPTYRGSLYKLDSNAADHAENYVSFKLNGSGTLFGLDGVCRVARLQAVNKNFFSSVTALGSEGYNWGVGAFLGTVIENPYANVWSIQFKFEEFPPNVECMWLLYGGSKLIAPVTTDIAFGAYVTNEGKLVYFRRNGSSIVSCSVDITLGEWNQVDVSQPATHEAFVTVNRGTPKQKTVSCAAMPMLGLQYDDVLLGCGPSVTKASIAPTGDVYDRTLFSDVLLRRFYVETVENFSNTAGDYFIQPFVKLEFQYEGSQEWVDKSSFIVSWPCTQDNRQVTYQIPDGPLGTHKLRLITHKGTSSSLPVAIEAMSYRKVPLFADFSTVTEFYDNWLIAHKQWGGTASQGQVYLNGGVVRENVQAFPQYKDSLQNVDGVVRLRGHGEFYSGDISGVDRVGNPQARKTEAGSCLASKEYLGPGRYRARVRSPYRKGACTAIWTFHYEEIYENDLRWDAMLADGDNGLKPQGNSEDGFYLVRNHEIDIEYPTALKNAVDMEAVDYKNARMNTWQGESRNYDVAEGAEGYWTEYADFFEPWSGTGLNDGQWHEIGFDWHTDDPNPPAGKPARRVDFYLDGVLRWTNTTHIPDIPGRLWLGVWYPRAPGNRWAGYAADYVYDSLDVDWFEYTPFSEPVREIGETYPSVGWRGWKPENFNLTAQTLPAPYALQSPYQNDAIPKDSEGFWKTSSFILAGANPPQFIGPYRLEWRLDRKAFGVGAGECIFTWLTANVKYKITVEVRKVINKSGGLQVVTFETGVPYLSVPAEVGSYSFTFIANKNRRVAVRRNNTTTANRDFVGTVDVKIEIV